jgi:hypothetical protein
MLSKMIQMTNINAINSIYNIIINIVLSGIAAYPAKVCWNLIAPIYLNGYIPSVFLNINYLSMMSFFVVCTFLGDQIQKLTPKIISISKEN